MFKLSNKEFYKLVKAEIIEIPKQRFQDIQDVLDIQCSDGNWNYDEYMHGLANGMILVDSIVGGKEPMFLEAPDKWLANHVDHVREKIRQLGDNFRGLWVSKILENDTTKEGWSVTFLKDGDMVETPMKNTLDDALDYAIQQTIINEI